MRVETLHSGIELEMFAILLARLLHQPVKKFSAVPGRAIARPRHQIIHVKKAS